MSEPSAGRSVRRGRFCPKRLNVEEGRLIAPSPTTDESTDRRRPFSSLGGAATPQFIFRKGRAAPPRDELPIAAGNPAWSSDASRPQDTTMATVILFHSVYGLRPFERAVAERLAVAGHEVFTPDLYEGRVASSIDEGFAIKEEIGWRVLCARAERSVAGLPADAVLGGFSMGAAVAASLWPTRPETAGVLFLHSIAEIPANARPGVPVQVHLADPDVFEPADEVAAWRSAAETTPIDLEVFTYAGAGHLYTDATLPDYDSEAAHLTWSRVERCLAAL
nr:dienelactone hydrolase family protein [Sinorhizobium medicae]